jgi:hypothetical protein
MVLQVVCLLVVRIVQVVCLGFRVLCLLVLGYLSLDSHYFYYTDVMHS